MRLAEALQAHIEDQYGQYVENTKSWSSAPMMSREEYAAEGSSQFTIAAEVGSRVAMAMGELVTFGVFDNCREHGITVTAPGRDLDPATGWTFCVYEHRNSDEICLEGCPTAAIQTWGPYGGESKYDVLHRSRYEDYASAATAMVAMLRATVDLKLVGRRPELKHIAADAAPLPTYR